MDRLAQANRSPWRAGTSQQTSVASSPVPLTTYLTPSLSRVRYEVTLQTHVCILSAPRAMSASSSFKEGRCRLSLGAALPVLVVRGWPGRLTAGQDATFKSRIAMCAGGSKEFLVRASYLEIYNEEIRDLLSKNPQQRLELKEHPDRGVYVKDLMQFVVKSVAEINSVLQVGLVCSYGWSLLWLLCPGTSGTTSDMAEQLFGSTLSSEATSVTTTCCHTCCRHELLPGEDQTAVMPDLLGCRLVRRTG